MEEVKFDIIKPNLYTRNGNIFIGLWTKNVVPVSEIVDEVIRKHIGELKVKDADLEIVRTGKTTREAGMEYTTPLNEFLNALKEKEYIKGGKHITNGFLEHFGVSWIIDAHTFSNATDLVYWQRLAIDLADPNKTFDEYERDNLVYRFDRERTLAEMKKLRQGLEQKIPDSSAELVIHRGEFFGENAYHGFIGFIEAKEEGKPKVEQARTGLIDKLRKYKGPCLSFDAPNILSQASRLYLDEPYLTNTYGDILTDPNWRRRFFRVDP